MGVCRSKQFTGRIEKYGGKHKGMGGARKRKSKIRRTDQEPSNRGLLFEPGDWRIVSTEGTGGAEDIQRFSLSLGRFLRCRISMPGRFKQELTKGKLKKFRGRTHEKKLGIEHLRTPGTMSLGGALTQFSTRSASSRYSYPRRPYLPGSYPW
jgi:hypothetical protein